MTERTLQSLLNEAHRRGMSNDQIEALGTSRLERRTLRKLLNKKQGPKA